MICVWGRQGEEFNNPEMANEEEFYGEYEDDNMVILDHKLRGIGYLNLFKLLHEEELKHVKDHEKNITMRIWYHGKDIGCISADALINHCPFVRQ